MLQPQCRGHAMRGRKWRREEGAPYWSRVSIPLASSPLPFLLPSSARAIRSKSRLWRLEDMGRGVMLPKVSALEGGGCGDRQSSLPLLPGTKGHFRQS